MQWCFEYRNSGRSSCRGTTRHWWDWYRSEIGWNKVWIIVLQSCRLRLIGESINYRWSEVRRMGKRKIRWRFWEWRSWVVLARFQMITYILLWLLRCHTCWTEIAISWWMIVNHEMYWLSAWSIRKRGTVRSRVGTISVRFCGRGLLNTCIPGCHCVLREQTVFWKFALWTTQPESAYVSK